MKRTAAPLADKHTMALVAQVVVLALDALPAVSEEALLFAAVTRDARVHAILG